MKGTYIALEGPDGSGTTSHVALLADFLRSQGKKVEQTAEPTTGPIGSFIRERLKTRPLPPGNALQLLYCADRAMHMEVTVKPMLEADTFLISDRCYLSTLAYGEALGLDYHWLERVNAEFVKPDITILALPSLEVCLERLHGRVDLDQLETDSLQARVHRAYLRMAKEHSEWIVIDTAGPKEEVAAFIAEKVTAILDVRQERKLAKAV